MFWLHVSNLFWLHVSNLFSIHDLAAGGICINTGNLFGMEFSYRYYNKMSE